jgi:hypothetical protein
MTTLKYLIASLYAYCSDFVMNLANLTGLSYYEINAILFCYLFPVVLIGLVLLNVYLKFKIYKMK